MQKYHSVFLLLLGALFFHQTVQADAVINLSQTVAGPAVLNEDGSYTVTYIITAENTGDTAGTYDLVLEFLPTEEIGAIRNTLEYTPGGETQTGTPVLNGPLVVEGFDISLSGFFLEPYQIISDEMLAPGSSETWTLKTVFEAVVIPAAPRDRDEGGDFLNSIIDNRSCDDNNPVENTGFFHRVSGSDSDLNDSDNTACTDLPPHAIDIAIVADGSASRNDYDNYNVTYTIAIANKAQGLGYYGLDMVFQTGPGIEMVMSFLTCESGCDSDLVVNPPATANDPAPINRDGRWVHSQLVKGAKTHIWKVTVAFKVAPAQVTSPGSDCNTGNDSDGNTGFSLNVTDQGGFSNPPLDENLSDNTACAVLSLPLPALPDINVSQVSNGFPSKNPDESYTIEYAITATNSGDAPGLYDLVYEFAPALGITLVTATLSYTPGGENQGGVPTLDGPLDFSEADVIRTEIFDIDKYTKEEFSYERFFYTLVMRESLAAGASESWTVTATFSVNPGVAEGHTGVCNPAAPQRLTGFYARVTGNRRVSDSRNKNYFLGDELADNETCVSFSDGILINPGLNGAWFFPGINGQGFFLDVFPDINLVFFAWFTYDTESQMNNTAQLGHSNHRWLTGQGPFAGSSAILEATLTRGGLFDNPTEVINTTEGTIVLTFQSCKLGIMQYNFPKAGVSGRIPLQRLADDNVPICESLQ